MKYVELAAAVALVAVISGCQLGQGESPNENQGNAEIPRTMPVTPKKPGASASGPMSIAGDPVAGGVRQTPRRIPTPANGGFGGAMPGGAMTGARGGPMGPAMPASPGSGPRMPAQPSPSRLKADKEVSGYFKNPEGMSIGIEAVCQITEDTVICKKPGGGRDKNLEARLDKILQGDQNMYSSPISFKYRKRNRFILFKKEYPMQGHFPMAYSSIAQVGEDPSFMSGGYINVSSLSQPIDPQKPRIEYEIRPVSVPVNQKTVNVYINSTLPVPIEGEIKLVKGSKLASGTLSISFDSFSASNDRMFGPDVKVWEVVFKTRKPDTRVQYGLSPIIKDADAGYSAIDQNGDIVKAGMYSDGGAKNGNRPRVSMRSAMAVPIQSSPTEIRLKMNVNPKHVSGFRVTVWRSQIIKMKDIALD